VAFFFLGGGVFFIFFFFVFTGPFFSFFCFLFRWGGPSLLESGGGAGCGSSVHVGVTTGGQHRVVGGLGVFFFLAGGGPFFVFVLWGYLFFYYSC